MWQRLNIGVAVLVCVMCVPIAARAQAIGGAVSDTTGSALPGVTIDVRSPALIEQVRTVVTDGAGQYLVIQLEPGLYTVTFSLPGFSTFVREGIELIGEATATVDGVMQVGSVEETITVSGAAPTVDIQNAGQQAVMTREDRTKGFFVAFGYTSDALREIDAFFRKSGKAIIALTVREILDEEIARKLA